MTVYPVDTPFTPVIEGPVANQGWQRPVYPPQPMLTSDPIQKRMVITLALAVVIVGILMMSALRLNGTADPGAGAMPESDVSGSAAAAPALTPQPINSSLSPVFTPEIHFWANDIVRWAAAHSIGDPNLVAIVMQIESCGFQDAQSSAGATGLFQVMPFHFEAGENAFDPETNAYRGMLFLSDLLHQTNEVGLAFAGYNGGPSLMVRSWDSWPNETQRYYRWATGIYQDIQSGQSTSTTLQQWLEAGGSSLCQQAAARQSQTPLSN